MNSLQFKSITFKNFKTFTGGHTFELERQPGLYYITGKNLLNPELGANGVGKSTLFDAMFWCLWGKTVRDNRPADAVRPWSGEKNITVSLEFHRNGIEYTVERNRNPNHLTLWTIHGPKGDSEREIQQEEVAEVLGMSEEMFRRTLVLGQFGTLFLDLKPEEQARMFTEALDLNVWLRATDAASQAGKKAAQQETQAEASLTANVSLLAGVGEDIADAESRSALFEIDKAARLAKIRKGIDTLEENLEDLDDSPKEQPTLPNTSKSANLAIELSEKRARLQVAASSLKRLEADLNTSEARLATFTKQSSGKKTCPACGQEISDAEFTKKKKAAQTEAANLVAETETQLASVAALRESALKLSDDHFKAVEAEAVSVSNYDSLLKLYNDYQSRLQAVRAELARQRSALAQEESSVNQAEASLARLRGRRTTYRAEQGELKEKAALAASQAEEAEFWINSFRELRLSVIDSALIELEMAASRHAAMLGLSDWGIKFDTERETQGGKVSYGFSVLLYPPGQDEPVKWESYSGGESQRWQLAVAFGLSEVLLARAGLSPNLEVLDEPTRGLSSDGVGDLLDHLRDRALELGRAIYFVDHHSLDKGAFDGTLVVEKTAQGSTFKWQ